MGTIEISDLFSYSMPFIMAYNIWLHNQIVSAKIDIAVNNTSDKAQQDVLTEIKNDIRAMREDIHALANQSNE